MAYVQLDRRYKERRSRYALIVLGEWREVRCRWPVSSVRTRHINQSDGREYRHSSIGGPERSEQHDLRPASTIPKSIVSYGHEGYKIL